MALLTFVVTYLVVMMITGMLCALFGAGKVGFKLAGGLITALALVWAVSAIFGGVL